MSDALDPGADRDAPLSGTVLVTVDSLRADALTPAVTPTLSTLASRSATFERAFAHGNWTPFSFPSILGSRPVFWDDTDVGLPESPTLAEVLSDAGVTTAGFNAANGFLAEHWGYHRGFDRFESFVDDPDGMGSRYLAAHPTVNGWVQLAAAPLHRVRNLLREDDPKPFVDVSHLWDVEEHAIEFLEGVDEPFFLWVHYMDAHTPYVPAPKHLRAVGGTRRNLLTRLRAHLHTGLGRRVDDDTLSALRTLYRGAVNQVDASVGRLLSTLEAASLCDSTLVIVTGDHGEAFQEHGHLAHYPTLYDELVRVPLLIHCPGAAPRRVTAPVGHEAIPPTVCDAMDVPPTAFRAESLLPTVRDGNPPEGGPVTSLTVRGDHLTQQPIPRRLDDGEVVASARDDCSTYIYHADSDRRELYDRRADPGETRDLFEVGSAPDGVVESLHASVVERLAKLHGGGEDVDSTRGEAPPELERRLEALGYR